MRVVDLCAGTGAWQRPFERHGWETVGVDIHNGKRVDIVADVRQAKIDTDAELVVASPPCRPYSSAWNAQEPPAERDPDVSVWLACVEQIAQINPEFWVVENTRQAAYWFGKADKTVGPYSLWGEFPVFDAPKPERKTRETSGGRRWVADSEEAAAIPYELADALRRSVEWSLNGGEP